MVDVVLGYDDLNQYRTLSGRMGAVIGRYANRVRDGKFFIDENEYNLSINRGNHHIHGGFKGFDKQIWDVQEHDAEHIVFSLESKDGDEGYPGNFSVTTEYRLLDHSLEIRYVAISDKDTICNLTNHSYFNLSGFGNINNHYVEIRSNRYISTGEDGIPINGPMSIPDDMLLSRNEIIGEKAFDLDFIIDCGGKSAVCCSDESGITMSLSTNMPALRFYTGDGLGESKGKKGKRIGSRSGMCFETQFPADSPNLKGFDDCILRKGKEFNRWTRFTFSLN